MSAFAKPAPASGQALAPSRSTPVAIGCGRMAPFSAADGRRSARQGTVADGRPVRFRVRIDGKPPLSEHGADIDDQGNGARSADRGCTS
ncbi:hypothetical protein D8B34_24130 [Verminephrobacter eiseniae]|nr:hypothetical protein [Verminephrobacter eiseniae]MCW8187414.1 hypothetical protein [Verminephrobacter eiseniae]MCW8225751.1 hypothetical protein [Verminephrobacter eiseniae]MCW8236682.1 hypothetical protein [Verminephrobacter eiseniae]